MRRVELALGADFDGFRDAVRRLTAEDIAPDDVVWDCGGTEDLFGASSATEAALPVALPKGVADLIGLVVCHRDPERYSLLYRLVWRIRSGERSLMDVASDPLVHRLEMMRKAVSRDLHKMHAFLRFRRIETAEEERFFAWFEPEHFIVEKTAQFFVDRFAAMDFTIVTPVGSLHWDKNRLTIGPAGERSAIPSGDAFETGWLAYYESIFNPARLNTTAMRAEMPKKYWKNMPEAKSISGLIQTAPSRVRSMIEKEATMPAKRIPGKALAAMSEQEPKSLDELNRIIAASEPLVPGATQAVLGEGPLDAAIAFVGEQPGDQEDIQGRPFVGPAGQLLERAMEDAGIRRGETYLTNAVKHFKYEQRGKRRLHKSPTTSEVKHYRWWLMKELDFVHPKIVVALGATAALALAGKATPIGRNRGSARFDGKAGYITVHPSYLLRLPDQAAKDAAYRDFVEDLKRIRAAVA